MPRLIVDIDNTMGDCTGMMRDWLRHEGSTMPMPEPDAYDLSEATGWNLPDGFRETHHAMIEAWGYLLMDPYRFAAATLRDLRREGWELIAATSREHSPTVMRETEEWCALMGVGDVVFDPDKERTARRVGAAAAIEDNPSALSALAGSGLRTLRIMHGYNRRSPGEPCADWTDVRRLLGGKGNRHDR